MPTNRADFEETVSSKSEPTSLNCPFAFHERFRIATPMWPSYLLTYGTLAIHPPNSGAERRDRSSFYQILGRESFHSVWLADVISFKKDDQLTLSNLDCEVLISTNT